MLNPNSNPHTTAQTFSSKFPKSEETTHSYTLTQAYYLPRCCDELMSLMYKKLKPSSFMGFCETGVKAPVTAPY